MVLGVTEAAEQEEMQRASQPQQRTFQYEVVRLPTRRGRAVVGEVVGVWVPYKDGGGPALLYSHGNAVDLGHMLPFYRELSELLRISVFSYDYSGYGCSSGTPCVSLTSCDVDAAYNCLRTKYSKAPEDIVLYGQSVGSGPSIHMAARADVGGLVIHSGLLSGMRVLHPEWKSWPAWADIYANHKLMPLVKCPVFVMHGTEDEVIDLYHGKQLAALARNAYNPLWADGYNHQNLERCPDYVPRLRQFLTEVFGDRYKGAIRRVGGVLR